MEAAARLDQYALENRVCKERSDFVLKRRDSFVPESDRITFELPQPEMADLIIRNAARDRASKRVVSDQSKDVSQRCFGLFE